MWIDPKNTRPPIASAAAARRRAGRGGFLGGRRRQSTNPRPRPGPPRRSDRLTRFLRFRRRPAREIAGAVRPGAGMILLDALDRLKAGATQRTCSDFGPQGPRAAPRGASRRNGRSASSTIVIAHIELRAQVELAKLGGWFAGWSRVTRRHRPVICRASSSC